MGMYDSIIINTICPYCKTNSDMELQTKAGQQMLHRYKIGDVFDWDVDDLFSEQELLQYHKDKDNSYHLWLVGLCLNCKVSLRAMARVDVDTKQIKEVEIFEYSVKTEIKVTK